MDEKIEGMARVFIKASCKGSECEKCLFIDSVKEAEECCVCLKAFYNTGYRKESDTAIEILTELSDFVNGWFEGVENNDFCVEFNRISQALFEKYNGGK